LELKLPEEITRVDSEPAAEPAREESRVSDALPDWLSYIAEPRHAWPILLIFGVALYLVNLGGYPLYTKGEPREAVTVFDIVHGGGVILPQRAGVEIPSKPLLMHWLAALVSIVAGDVNEFSVRLPSAGLAIAGLLVCYFYVRRLFDNVTALIAALILATTFQYLQAATGARVDMTLTFFMEVAFFEFIFMAEGLTHRRMLLYVAIALAVLTKGPIGLILPGMVALIWIALEKRWNVLLKMSLFRGAIVVLVLAGGWYVAALIEGGPDFFRKQILAENLLRFAGGRSGRARAARYRSAPQIPLRLVRDCADLLQPSAEQARGVPALLVSRFRDPARDLRETGYRAAGTGAHLRPLDRAIVWFLIAAARQRRSGCARDACRMAACLR
jgi:hypothetical protein